MKSTLFFIPHEFFGVPLFGWGWALGLLMLAIVVSIFVQLRGGLPWSDIVGGVWVWLLAIPIIVVALPSIEQTWPDGTPIGLPIRGYGTMVLLGMLAGIGITTARGKQLGIKPDLIVGLAVWAMLGGIAGARIFFVVQKWETFNGHGMERLIEIIKLTEGGLVVYGGIFGGLLAGVIFCYRNRLNLLATGDLIVPGFFIGLSLGRIGCLMNGCCFGGVCMADLPVIHFPPGSLPYQVQLSSGQLLGMSTHGLNLPTIVQSVEPDSPADRVGIKPGDQLRSLVTRQIEPSADSDPTVPAAMLMEIKLDNTTKRIMPEDLPERSLPVHPAQIYAAINALLLCLLMWQLQPAVNHDGIVFFTGVALYAGSRFLLEWIRSDEAGQLGTQLTIAQLISIVSGIVGMVSLIYLMRKPQRRAWAWV